MILQKRWLRRPISKMMMGMTAKRNLVRKVTAEAEILPLMPTC